MPTYDYVCGECGHRFEKFQSIRAKKLARCPLCGGKVKRLIGTGAGIIFKGSGFYQTDYRSKGYQEAEKKEKEKTKPPAEKAPSEKKKTPESTSPPALAIAAGD
ncbi:MAG: FmdB family zinc ribbon protein [PVC group bacterium]